MTADGNPQVDLSAPMSVQITVESFVDLEIGDRVLYTEVRSKEGFRWSTAVSGTVTRTGVDGPDSVLGVVVDEPWVEVGDEYEVFAKDLGAAGPGQLYLFPPTEEK